MQPWEIDLVASSLHALNGDPLSAALNKYKITGNEMQEKF